MPKSKVAEVLPEIGEAETFSIVKCDLRKKCLNQEIFAKIQDNVMKVSALSAKATFISNLIDNGKTDSLRK